MFKEDFYSVLKRVMAKRNAEPARTTVVPQITLEEQLSIMARVKAKREAALAIPATPVIDRRTHRDMLKAYSAN